MATSNTCVRLSIIASPRSFDPDGADNVPNPVIVPPALAIYVRYALDDEPLGNVTPSVCNRRLLHAVPPANHPAMYMRFLPAGFVPPCLPTKALEPPSGEAWLHEIKHDGFRVIARKKDKQVRLYSRPGNDLTYRFPLIVEALAKLRLRSCIIDGEAVACDGNGVPSFDRIRYRWHDASVFLYAFDLIELNGDDLR